MGAGAATRSGRGRPTDAGLPSLPGPRVTQVGEFGRRTMPAGRALLVVLIALLLGSLLNVRSLTEAAERQPPGLKRDVSIVLVWPFQQVSGLLGLDQPRELLTQRLGRDEDAGTGGGGAEATAETGGLGDGVAVAPVEGGDALATAAALAGREAVDTALGDATAIPAEGTADADGPGLTDRLQRPFSATDPLRVGIIGDSLTEQIGPTMVARLNRPGVPSEGFHDFTYSSGLSRPDFYDWQARAAQLLEEEDADVWVVMMGANDAQDVVDADGRFHQLGSDEWEDIYRGRTGALMDLLTSQDGAVIWVGQPIMRDPEFDERMAYLTTLYAAEAAERPLVSFVDARQVFAGADGRYADYLPAGNGQLSQMRLPDGIHLTRSGAERLVTQVMPLLPLDEPGAPEG